MADTTATQANNLHTRENKLIVVKAKKAWVLAYTDDLGLKSLMPEYTSKVPETKKSTSPKPTTKIFTPFTINNILSEGSNDNLESTEESVHSSRSVSPAPICMSSPPESPSSQLNRSQSSINSESLFDAAIPPSSVCELPSVDDVSRCERVPSPSESITTEADESYCRAKNRRPRTSFTLVQSLLLERVFQTHPYPDHVLKSKLAEELQLTDTIIVNWFQNRRNRWKRESECTFHYKITTAAQPYKKEQNTEITTQQPYKSVRTIYQPGRIPPSVSTCVLPWNSPPYQASNHYVHSPEGAQRYHPYNCPTRSRQSAVKREPLPSSRPTYTRSYVTPGYSMISKQLCNPW